MRKKIITALGAAALIAGLAGSAAATASVRHHLTTPHARVMPVREGFQPSGPEGKAVAAPGSLLTGIIWKSDKICGGIIPAYCYLWFRSHDHLFHNASAGDTPLADSTCNSSDYCLRKLPNGKCMQYVLNGTAGKNVVNDATCNRRVKSQLWGVFNLGNGLFEWTNYYLNSIGVDCGTHEYDEALTSNGDGPVVYLACPISVPLPARQLWFK